MVVRWKQDRVGRSIESDGTVGNDTHCVDSGWKFEMVAVYKERARLSNRITYRTNNLLHHSPYFRRLFYNSRRYIVCIVLDCSGYSLQSSKRGL